MRDNSASVKRQTSLRNDGREGLARDAKGREHQVWPKDGRDLIERGVWKVAIETNTQPTNWKMRRSPSLPGDEREPLQLRNESNTGEGTAVVHKAGGIQRGADV